MQGREMVVYGKDAPLPTWQGRAFPHDVLTDYVKSEEAANADPLAPKFLGSDCHHQAPKIRKATPSELDHPPQFSE